MENIGWKIFLVLTVTSLSNAVYDYQVKTFSVPLDHFSFDSNKTFDIRLDVMDLLCNFLNFIVLAISGISSTPTLPVMRSRRFYFTLEMKETSSCSLKTLALCGKLRQT